MEVEGIHFPSDDTEAGQRVHRRVDAPSQSPHECCDADAETGQPRSLSSLTLTSNLLGLTATLDVAEAAGFTVTDLSASPPTLETVFIQLTGKDLRE